MTASATFERIITLEAVHNFRDLGDYPTAAGRRTRPQRLYRADGLYRLTPADVETLRPLGLHTVIDLRTIGEIDDRGRFPVEALGVGWHHLPVVDVTWEQVAVDERSAADFLYDQYTSMLAYGEPLFAAAMRTLALPGALPGVFHCAAGKDRTGLLAALLLGALGVADDVIVADYALTRAGMERMRRWAETTSPELYASWQTMPAVHAAAEPEAMARVLADIHAAHGALRDYVRSLGVPAAALEALEDDLLV
jgi:protein-tyrosine phosphatase